jgi:P27 family predicted phage terminase small subunit
MPTPRKDLTAHELQGTKARYSEPSSEVAAGRPKFPKNFTGEMKATFKRIVRLLETRRVCTQGDAEIVRLFCVALDRHNRALEHIRAEGEICAYTRLDSNGQPHEVWKENLWLKVCTDAEKLQLAALDRLGLTPLNRGKIKPATDPKNPKPLTPEEEATLSREATQPTLDDEPDLSKIDETLIQ